MTQQFIQERVYLKGVSPRTVTWYECSFRAFAGALESKQTIIGRIAQLKEKGTSHITINSYLRCVNAYFRWNHIENGKELIHIPKLKEEQKVLATFDAEHIKRLIDSKPVGRNQIRVHALALTALDSGLRINELLSLSRDSVNFDNLTLQVQGKGNQQRLVPMSAELRKVLYRYLTRHEHRLVFCTKHGSKLLHGNVRRDFQIICRKAGIIGVRCSFHTLRHSFAVGYLRRGGNLEFLRRILGHSSILTTQKYLRSLGVEDLQAVHNDLSLLNRRS